MNSESLAHSLGLFGKRLALVAIAFVLAAGVTLPGCSSGKTGSSGESVTLDGSSLPEYEGKAVVEVNNNEPKFTEEEKNAADGTEEFGSLDSEGRCTRAFAKVGEETTPETERGNISEVKPTGWHSTRYSVVNGGSLYNRCHLIAYCLSGQNANKKNLITGTRYLNVDGMLPYEEKVANYVDQTSNHVLYKVEPIFEGDNLVASGVRMQGLSVEDNGEGISFDVYCFNVQPGVAIDYQTGDSKEDSSATPNTEPATSVAGYGKSKKSGSSNSSTTSSSASESVSAEGDTNNTETKQRYVLNTRSMKFHKRSCEGAKSTSSKNKQDYVGLRSELIELGYTPCPRCNP